MKGFVGIVVLLIITLSLVSISCRPHSSMQKSTQDRDNTITGRIFVTGTEPLIYLAIEAQDGSIFLIDPHGLIYSELFNFQNKTVKLIGEFTFHQVHGTVFLVESFEVIESGE